MIEQLLCAAALRFMQSLIQAAPFIVVGLFVTGIFQRMFGQANTRRVFGENSWRSLPQAWAIGMLLPVCSLGVIPIVREMRRAGVAGGTILAFALAAPLFNPLSFLYGLTLSKPLAIFAFAGCSLVVVSAVGAVWDRIFPDSIVTEPAPPAVPNGLKRLASVLVVVLREITGPSLGYILAGLAGSALLAAILPHGYLQSTMNQGNSWAPLAMAGVSIPAFATPMLAMSQLGSMFQHGNSVGAAFVLLTLGAGLNLGLLAWMASNYGWRRSLAWLILLVVLGLAYAVNKPLSPRDIDPADHTHAFDIYTSPFAGQSSNPAAEVMDRLRRDTLPLDKVTLAMLAGLVAGGLGLRVLDRWWRVEAWLEREPAAAVPTGSRWNFVVSPAVIGGVLLASLFAFSIVGCYAYYPPADEVFEEMRIARGEALGAALAGNVKECDHWMAVWDEWTRKLEVGVYLRTWGVSPYQHIKARILREKMEMLRHEVEEGDKAAIRQMIGQVEKAHRRMREAFLNPSSPPGSVATN
jgi:hypothetical protein